MERIRNLRVAARRMMPRNRRPQPSSRDTLSPSVDTTEKDLPDVDTREKGIPDETLSARISTYSSESSTVYVDPYNYNSPYAEVRASVPNYDDESMPQNTVRMWVIGLFLMSGITAINTIFFIHQPPLRVKAYCSIVLAWLLGWVWEQLVPNVWGLNPGKFTYKEHALIAVMALTPTMSLVSDTVITSTYYYNTDSFSGHIVCTVLLSWASEFIGIALAGLFRSLLVDPPSMVWPAQLVIVTLLSNMHIKWNHVANGWRITRKRFFIISCVSAIFYECMAQFFFKFLGEFAVFSWIAPNNYVVNQLFGAQSGAGMLPLCFDWNTVGGYFFMSPLVPPARVFANVAIAVVLILWLATSGVHYSNVWWGQYIPFADFKLYDRFGNWYTLSKITKDVIQLDLEKFKSYSAIFLPNSRIIGIGMGLATSTSVLVYALLYETPRLVSYYRKKPRDIHSRLMQKYGTIPMWWFAVLFVTGVVILYPTIFAFDVGIPGWYPVLAIAGIFIWFLPVASVYASTTIYINLTMFSQVIAGYMFQKTLTAMIMYRDWPNNAIDTGVEFAAALKLGHYTKVRPRLVFLVRIVGIIWSGILQMILLMTSMPPISNDCKYDEKSSIICGQAQTVYTDATMFGIVGTKNIMHLYGPIMHFLWIGALVPALCWLWLRKWPRSKLRIMHWPLFFNIFQRVPPARPYNLCCWVVAGIISSYWVKRYWHSWWAKYCYTLSAALDVGLSVVQLILFFAFDNTDYHGPSWWGNTGFDNNIDGKFEPMKRPAPGHWFGPSNWWS